MQGYLSLMALKRYVLLLRDENNLGKSKHLAVMNPRGERKNQRPARGNSLPQSSLRKPLFSKLLTKVLS